MELGVSRLAAAITFGFISAVGKLDATAMPKWPPMLAIAGWPCLPPMVLIIGRPGPPCPEVGREWLPCGGDDPGGHGELVG